MLKGVVDEGAVPRKGPSRPVRDVASANSRIDDVRVGRRNVVENRLIHTEVLSKDTLRRVGDPVINVESCAEST